MKVFMTDYYKKFFKLGLSETNVKHVLNDLKSLRGEKGYTRKN